MVATVGFLVALVVATRNAVVPVGGSGVSTGSLRGATLRLAMRDVSGRTLRLPGGRPGVVLFVQAQGCPPCVEAVRSGARAVRSTGGHARLVVIEVDSQTTRGEVAAFARAAGQPPARYVVDDRIGTLAATFGASAFDTAVVYDGHGHVVARPWTTSEQLARALRLAGR